MKQTQAFLSIYTADVSGVCSALFELGGMVVMHDPSGCNSTYHTHDEPRWYDFDSLIFISGLSEIEAIMGDDQKLIDDVVTAANQLSPRFIALASTPVPTMIGTDMEAIAEEIENISGIPTFFVETNGTNSYIFGAGRALKKYAEKILPPEPKQKIAKSVNILGATPLDFSINGSIASIQHFLADSGWKVLSTWAMNSSYDSLDASSSASVNLVVSSVGLEVAKLLREKFGTPYVTGAPCGEAYNKELLKSLEAASENPELSPLNCDISARNSSSSEITVIGESITARSLANAIYLETGKPVRVLSPLETDDGILSEFDTDVYEEEDIENELKNAKIIIADPMYRPVAPKIAKFIELPHEAYSGRIYRKRIPNLTNGSVSEILGLKQFIL